MSTAIQGYVASGYERVAEAFEQSFGDEAPSTSQCCAHVDGEVVADLWAAPADAIEVVLSATRGAVAGCAKLPVQRGLLDLDASVATYWPEYGTNGAIWSCRVPR